MSSQSGFLNCFLKFIQGERGEKLPDMTRGRPASDRFAITMNERNAILNASRQRLTREKKSLGALPEKQTRKPGRPRKSTTKQGTQLKRSKGSISELESESGGNDGSESQSGNEERLCTKIEASDKEECKTAELKSEDTKCGDEKCPLLDVDHQIEESERENEKDLRDRRKTRNSVDSEKKSISSNNATEAGPADCESSVISNGEAITTDKKDSVDCTPISEKKKRGRKRKNNSGEDSTPVRKLSSRKAKQKAKISYAESDEEDILGLEDNSDSDDPVWVPDEKKASSDEGSNFSWSKYDKLHLKSKKSSGSTPVNQSKIKVKVEEKGVKQISKESPGNANSGSAVSGSVGALKGEGGSGKKIQMASQPTLTMAASSSNGHLQVNDSVPNIPAKSTAPDISIAVVKNDLFSRSLLVMPFQSGTFIAQKSDLEEKEEPPIWRVDGKSLLQKYEPFRIENGSTWYRNVSTYSGWGPKSHLQYQEVPVKFIKQNRVETIVEIIKAELTINEDKLCEKIMKEYEKHTYAYEVFVQTMASQALDQNFLSEIIAEKDDYFLNAVEELENVCKEKKTQLMEACQWPNKFIESVTTWPTMTLTPNDFHPRNKCGICYACISVTDVQMNGNPYKSVTLEYTPPSNTSLTKEFCVCSGCCEILSLLHKIVHLKYHTFENALKLVSEKKISNPDINNTEILHEILADASRVKKEFLEISRIWAQAEIKSRRLKLKDKKQSITVV